MKSLILVTCLSFFTIRVNAGELDRFFEREVEQLSSNLEAAEFANEYAYVLSKMRLRLRGKAALEVPFLAKLEVKPFIEFHFQPR